MQAKGNPSVPRPWCIHDGTGTRDTRSGMELCTGGIMRIMMFWTWGPGIFRFLLCTLRPAGCMQSMRTVGTVNCKTMAMGGTAEPSTAKCAKGMHTRHCWPSLLCVCVFKSMRNKISRETGAAKPSSSIQFL